MSGLPKIVVSGATGKQGRALINALLALPKPQFEIFAVSTAQKLAASPNVRLVEGNFNNPQQIFGQVSKPWGFFSMTNPMNAKKEEAQGKAMTSAAISAGVKHIVFTATDRGPQTDTDPTVVPHFASKYHIEQDIIVQCKRSGSTYTFIRPVAFFENISNDFLGKGFVATWRLNGLDYPMQLVSTVDIGRVAADAFQHAGSQEYRNQAISLAGDDITPAQAARMFKEVTGQELIYTYPLVGRGLKSVLHEQLGIMFGWFKDVGFAADVAKSKQRYDTKDFRAWLLEESAWNKSA